MLKILKTPQTFSKMDYPVNPPFGTHHVPIMLWFDLKKGTLSPDSVHIEPLRDMPLSPFCSTLHYGQSIFEGMKVYRQSEDKVGIFRPDLHAKRFAKSAETMSMAPFSPELFMECIVAFVEACKDYVPREAGHSLYLRPLLIGNDPVIKLKSSSSYRFMIMGSIAGSYFNDNSSGQKALINKDFIRAFPGGTGEAKTSANYALSLRALDYAYSEGYDQVLYVDALKKEKIEELGGMNFFMVKDGAVYTPKLDGQILHGITRQSLLEIAKVMGLRSFEETVLLKDIADGKVTEVFASGTASSITQISALGLQERTGAPIQVFKYDNHEVAQTLLKYLVDTQYGRTETSSEWLHIV